MANMMMEVGAENRALDYFSECVRVDGMKVAPHLGLMLALKTNDLALNNLKTIVKNNPDNFEALTQLGIHFFLLKYDVKAIQLMHKALKINSRYVPALVIMGEIYRFRGQHE